MRHHARGCDLVFSASTLYYEAVTPAGEVVGFCGIAWHTRQAKLKTAYVFPLHRYHGYYREMVAARLSLIAARPGIRKVVATCTPASLGLLLRLGFVVTKAYANGCTAVERGA
jgi:RimJ/RimL family protein N-acetyltransferase